MLVGINQKLESLVFPPFFDDARKDTGCVQEIPAGRAGYCGLPELVQTLLAQLHHTFEPVNWLSRMLLLVQGLHVEPAALIANAEYLSKKRILVRVHGNFLSKWRWKHQKQGQSHALTRTGSSPSVFPLRVSLLIELQ